MLLSYDHLPIVSIESRKSIFEVYHSNGVTFNLCQPYITMNQLVLTCTFKPNVYSKTRMNLVSFTMYVPFCDTCSALQRPMELSFNLTHFLLYSVY